jgi:hypothetical protein
MVHFGDVPAVDASADCHRKNDNRPASDSESCPCTLTNASGDLATPGAAIPAQLDFTQPQPMLIFVGLLPPVDSFAVHRPAPDEPPIAALSPVGSFTVQLK